MYCIVVIRPDSPKASQRPFHSTREGVAARKARSIRRWASSLMCACARRASTWLRFHTRGGVLPPVVCSNASLVRSKFCRSAATLWATSIIRLWSANMVNGRTTRVLHRVLLYLFELFLFVKLPSNCSDRIHHMHRALWWSSKLQSNDTEGFHYASF